MRRTSIFGIGAIVAALLILAPAASAKVELAGGSTTLRLAQGTATALEANGVTVTPLRPARVRRGGVAFPITRGSIDPATAAGRIAHSSGLGLRAGRTRVAMRNFRVHVGSRRAILTARVGGGRLTVLSLSLRDARIQRRGLTTIVSRVRASLTGPAARALNATLRTGLFARGLPMGSVVVRAVPAQAELRRGATTLALDSGAAQALQSLGIQAAPVEPARSTHEGLAFPITGGRVNLSTFAGRITHSGGIRLSRGSTAVELTSFTIRVDGDPDLTALVGGSRVSILNLDLSQLDAQVSGRRINLSGVRAPLSAAAAEALGQAFSTDAFTEGLLFGTGSVAARAR